MNIFWLVTRHVDRQKDALLAYMLDCRAYDASSAVDLARYPVKPSILKEMMNRRIALRTPGGRYYVDIARLDDRHGASNRFILLAIGLTALAILLIALYPE